MRNDKSSEVCGRKKVDEKNVAVSGNFNILCFGVIKSGQAIPAPCGSPLRQTVLRWDKYLFLFRLSDSLFLTPAYSVSLFLSSTLVNSSNLKGNYV